MGNCQAAEAAEVIVQHPGGKVERLYWPTPAAEVMKTNPGHYVALVILRLSPDDKAAAGDEAAAAAAVAGAGAAAKITRVKLLKPKDVLHLGQVYRLITAQGSCTVLHSSLRPSTSEREPPRSPSSLSMEAASSCARIPSSVAAI
uniref:Uncharacterized protein n=1 Tax=Aegilops tauschii subsp. strangulata TaxID=200361 RepID=A0A453KRA9_AEGTS